MWVRYDESFKRGSNFIRQRVKLHRRLKARSPGLAPAVGVRFEALSRSSTRRSSRHLSRNRIFRPAASIALDIATERFSPTATPSPPVRARRKKDEGQRPTERGGKRIDSFRKSVESRPGRSRERSINRSRDAHLRRRRRPRREARRPSRSPERRPEGTRRRRRDEDVSLNRGGANARRRRRRRS